MNLVEEFKHLPSSLGIQGKLAHFKFLDDIIAYEINNYSKEMQTLFKALMYSFKSNACEANKEILKIQDMFIMNAQYKKNLHDLIKNVKERFNMIH